MLKRILGLLIAFPAFLLLVTLAVTNKHPVQLKLDPFRPDAPVLALEAPFFYFLLGGVILGVALGGLATWFTQSHWRRSARTRAQDAMRWRSEADRLARERDEHLEQSGGAAGLGKALAVIPPLTIEAASIFMESLKLLWEEGAAAMAATFGRVLRDQRDLLFFRPFKPDLPASANAYLAWGLFTTWIVGIGRYWDHPSAGMWQYAGLGSVAYVFVLAAILWAVIAPLKPENWSYRNVLLFVTLTSLPAILYAIPVEKFMDLGSAQLANVIFLAVVAIWRVALLLRFLMRTAKLDGLTATIACLLPLALIVAALTVLNLEKAVFEIMGGLGNQTRYDAAYGILVMITLLSILASPVLLILYGVQIVKRRRIAARPTNRA